jgi:hypothetical protein
VIITLHITSESTDIAGLNKLVSEADKAADIMLLSEYIEPHGDISKSMSSCLYAADKHAIVYGQEIENNKSLIETAREYLPEYDLTVQGNACCVLIKRSVIKTFGFLDTSFKSLQYALMDFYCRVNKFGFSSVVSYHSLYSLKDGEDKGTGSLSTTSLSPDKALFELRYDYWEDKIKRLERHGVNPCAEFLKVLDNEYYPKKRILFDCVIMPAMHCGTSEYQLSVFDAFYRKYKDKYGIYLYTNREADEYFDLCGKYENIFYPETLEGVFHLGFAPNQLMFFEPMRTLDKHCLKIVQTLYDIMMVRIDEHVVDDVSKNVEAGIYLSDGIVFISNFTKDDFKACFANNRDLPDKMLKVIYPAAGFDEAKKEYDLPFESYFLVIGNSYKHKAIKETIDVITNLQHNFIIIGYGDNETVAPNIHSYKSGNLDEDFLSFLYAKSTAVLFPSLYEGFGFPVVISLKNKKRVIINDNSLNKELMEHFKEFADYFLLFDDFAQIGDIIESKDFSVASAFTEYNDTWDRVATELESFFDEILGEKTDKNKLNRRSNLFSMVEANLINAEPLIKTLKEENKKQHDHIVELGIAYRQITEERRLLSLIKFSAKTFIRNRCPGLVRLLKRMSGKT